MERFLGRYSEQIYALQRIVVGVLLASHGTQKLFGFFGGQAPATTQFWIGGGIELVGGSLIALGLFAGYAAFVCSGMMAVAYFQFHFPHGFWPLVNKGEKAVVYAFIFLFIASKGGGIWSLSSLFGSGAPQQEGG